CRERHAFSTRPRACTASRRPLKIPSKTSHEAAAVRLPLRLFGPFAVLPKKRNRPQGRGPAPNPVDGDGEVGTRPGFPETSAIGGDAAHRGCAAIRDRYPARGIAGRLALQELVFGLRPGQDARL